MFRQMTLAAALFLSSIAVAEVEAGDKAPQFTLKDVDGNDKKLSDYAGKWVVLEWFNKNCPFVKKHYASKNMQNTQKKHTSEGVVWLTINSTHSKHKDYVKPDEAKADAKAAHATAYLLDSDGKVGKAYGAKTTPHMFVINPKQEVVYAGAIDDKPTVNEKDIETAKNYVDAALASAKADKNQKAVAMANTRPYGCSVKYQ